MSKSLQRAIFFFYKYVFKYFYRKIYASKVHTIYKRVSFLFILLYIYIYLNSVKVAEEYGWSFKQRKSSNKTVFQNRSGDSFDFWK